MVEVSLTVGKLDASLALLLTKDHHLIEFPTILLPNGVKAGSIVKIKCDQDLDTELEEAKQFQKIQDEILTTFGTNLPQSPNLKIKNITQTSCILEWDKLELGTSSLKNLILFKDGKKLGSIPQPLTNRTTKLSGLPIDKSFNFQLRLDTTAGIYSSNTVEVTTHKMTDLSGITVCVGDFSPNDPFTIADIEDALKKMGANYPPQDKIKVDTTHFICTRENKQNPEFMKASDMNIPIIRPEWLKACERERRIVGVRDFYIKDCVLPDIFAKNYWGSKHPSTSVSAPASQPEKQETGPAAPSEAEQNSAEAPHNVSNKSKQNEELPPLPKTDEAQIAGDSRAADSTEEIKIEEPLPQVPAESGASQSISNGTDIQPKSISVEQDASEVGEDVKSNAAETESANDIPVEDTLKTGPISAEPVEEVSKVEDKDEETVKNDLGENFTPADSKAEANVIEEATQEESVKEDIKGEIKEEVEEAPTKEEPLEEVSLDMPVKEEQKTAKGEELQVEVFEEPHVEKPKESQEEPKNEEQNEGEDESEEDKEEANNASENTSKSPKKKKNKKKNKNKK